MSNILNDFKRIRYISTSKIPVSEDSPSYSLFAERKEVCKRFLKVNNESENKLLLEKLSRLEDIIKEYLLL